jgi:aquaporin Z
MADAIVLEAARGKQGSVAHWPEYLIEAGLLGCFMVVACTAAVLLNHPASQLHQAVESATLRRVLGGLAMGLTALTIFRSPWGQRSGAHINPAVTWTYYLLGRVKRLDAAAYIAFQFLGAAAGVGVSEFILGYPLRHMQVNFAVTRPIPAGENLAFAAEFGISTLLMLTVLAASNHPKFARLTPHLAATLVAAFIIFESPLSGMSMNPARSFGSAVFAREWDSLWIYFTAPPLGMMTAAGLYAATRGLKRVYCAKLDHPFFEPCIFHCRHSELYDQH